MVSKRTSKKFRFRVTGARGAVYETTTYAEAKRLAGKRGVIERIGSKNPHCVSNPKQRKSSFPELEKISGFGPSGREVIAAFPGSYDYYAVDATAPRGSNERTDKLGYYEGFFEAAPGEWSMTRRGTPVTAIAIVLGPPEEDTLEIWQKDDEGWLQKSGTEQGFGVSYGWKRNPHLADTYSKVHAILKKEGGAAGLKALRPAFGAGATNIDKALPPHPRVPGVVRHGDGDYLKVRSGRETDVARYTNPSLPSGTSRELRGLPVGKTTHVNGKRVRRLDKDHWSVEGMRHKLANATVAVMG